MTGARENPCSTTRNLLNQRLNKPKKGIVVILVSPFKASGGLTYVPYEPETLTAPRKTLQKRAGSKDYLVRGRPSLSTQADGAAHHLQTSKAEHIEPHYQKTWSDSPLFVDGAEDTHPVQTNGCYPPIPIITSCICLTHQLFPATRGKQAGCTRPHSAIFTHPLLSLT